MLHKMERKNEIKKITRQEIVYTIAEVSMKEMKSIGDMLKYSMDKYENVDFLQSDSRTGFELSIMNTAIMMNEIILIETLCKLLCDEE